MARPSIAAERREQIIEATLTVITERGINGTTLDRIADKAGMSRGHVRHFVGNRDTLLVDAAATLFADETGEVGSIIPAEVTDIHGAIGYLFGPEFTSPDAENALVLGFVELSRTMPEIAEVLTAAYRATRIQLAELIQLANPEVNVELCRVTAYGILTCGLGTVFLGDFDKDPARPTISRAAAEALLATLSSPAIRASAPERKRTH